MKKILFPIDFSAASINAFKYALRFAAKMDAEILTLHVYDLPSGVYTDVYDYLTENYNISELGQFENFKSEVPKLREIAETLGLGHVRMSHMLESGNAVEAILSVQIAERVDFVVMGTKGASGLQEIFLGSVAEEVINRATVPVLAIPQKCAYHTIKNALFLTEFERRQYGALERLLDVLESFRPDVHVLQVKKNHEPTDDALLAQWKQQFEGTKTTFNILAHNAPEETVLDFIEIEDIHLVAMATRHKGFLERLFLFSLSRNLAYHAQVPVFSIPVEARVHHTKKEAKKAVSKSNS